MKKVFILLGVALLAGNTFGEVLSNGPTNGSKYTCQAYSCISIPVEMVFVQGGMLSSSNSGLDSVVVDDFYIGQYEVTQKQWQDVMGTTINDMYALRSDLGQTLVGVGDSYPMYFVSWEDAQAFVTELNALVGNGKFRLPTEAEWEYAAKGGSVQRDFIYAGHNTVGEVAWYSGNTNVTHPTDDLKAPNSIEIYNMSGNVWEWCETCYSGTESNCSARVLRGGSWFGDWTFCTVYNRFNAAPGRRNSGHGFRLACSSNS
jgi:formylglycine-generating enzyme required for sulfatase activity